MQADILSVFLQFDRLRIPIIKSTIIKKIHLIISCPISDFFDQYNDPWIRLQGVQFSFYKMFLKIR